MGFEHVSVTKTRQSVCAGDDVEAPHEETCLIPVGLNALALCERMTPAYLASIYGGRATWSLSIDDRLVAIWSQQNGFEYAFEVEPAYGEASRFHFDYHAQDEPQDVIQKIRLR